nr:sugar transferase [candidate division Zixibacteria bacterium]
MNENRINSSIETKATPSIAIPSTMVGYGRVISLNRGAISASKRRQSPGELANFYYGEITTGILFLLALISYTLIIPEGVSNPLKYVVGMIDKLFKKVLDIFGSILGLILALPILVVIPILIKLGSPGPVFYTQERVGINRRRRNRRLYRTDSDENRRSRDRRRVDNFGKPFKVIKFRTMVQDAEKKSGPVWATQNDSRVTRLGRFMRKTRIDEIPQLINVLMGDMSLVGPRPERSVFVRDLKEKVPNYGVRLRVKPGVTGLAQVSSGYDSSIESVITKVKHDVNYIRNWSIRSDLKILARTVLVVLTGKGAC